jgi:hypothetical protein
VNRGANLDDIDKPLNHALDLKNRFDQIRQSGTEAERLTAIAKLVEP